jgi:hypothetical protein
VARASFINMPYEYYEGQDPGVAGVVGGLGQGIGGNMVRQYVGQSLFGGGAAAAAAPTAAQAGMTTAMGMAQGMGKGAMGAFGFGAGAGAGAGAAGAAGLGAAIPAIGLGIMIVGGLLSAFASKPEKKKGYQKVAVAPRTPVPVPQLPGYGTSLPPGFRV